MASARVSPASLPENSTLTELQTLLDSFAELPVEQLPRLLGSLETVKAMVWLRMAAPSQIQAPADQLLDAPETAQRLNVSVDYLYRRSKQFPFTRREGRKLLFSARGLEAYIRNKDSNVVLTARRQKCSIGLAT